jgi:hypothetical protein
MAYSLEIADAVSRSVGKFVTLSNYQLAGHLANLDFWMRQIINALDAIDGYSTRQTTLELAQKKYISAHDTWRFSTEQTTLHHEFPEEPACEPGTVRPDRWRIDSETLKRKRREIVDSFYRFMLRCHKERLISGDRAKEALSECGIGVEPGDFRRESGTKTS